MIAIAEALLCWPQCLSEGAKRLSCVNKDISTEKLVLQMNVSQKVDISSTSESAVKGMRPSRLCCNNSQFKKTSLNLTFHAIFFTCPFKEEKETWEFTVSGDNN